MTIDTYRYAFPTALIIEDIGETLTLALLACEALHGEAQVRLDASYAFSAAKRTCVIRADTAVGRDLNRLFAGLIAREFGARSFTVKRDAGQWSESSHHCPEATAA